jgi:5-methylcytosine-specific restriction endonuclease McrA
MKVLENFKELKETQKAKVFKYKIFKTEPLENLYKYKDHRRLQTFYHKGVKCVECGHVGTQIGHGLDKAGNIHIDIYDDNLYPLNVDHIIPKSKGGANHIDNYQPMCYGCNNKKGNGDEIKRVKTKRQIKNELKKWLSENRKAQDIKVGDFIYKATYGEELGVVNKIIEHPHHKGNVGVMVVGNDVSIYTSSHVFKNLD